MPVIELHSPEPSPGAEALQQLSETVTAFLAIPTGRCWVLWHQIGDENAYRPEWAPRTGRRSPVGFVTCKEEYPSQTVTRMLRLIQEQLASMLDVPAEEVYLAVRRAAPEELLVRDQVEQPGGERSTVVCEPVGRVVGGREKVYDDEWGKVESVIRLDSDQFDEESLRELDSFSHLEVVFHFDRVSPAKIQRGARHPRGNQEWPLVGIFAQRGKNRPNRLGVSRCRLLKVEGMDIHVSGLDAVDGTPVLDVKPYLDEFGPRGPVRQPDWSVEVMRRYY